MESGLAVLHHLLHQTLKSLCWCPPADSSNSSSPISSSSIASKWIYAVFWRTLPRNFPPPKWEDGGITFDRSKGSKRNWILVWEDGFCDFQQSQQAQKFGPDVFFKMTHEVYSYGEGLLGKVAAENSHKWVYREPRIDNDSTIISSWHVFIDPQPKTWESQFNSGIQTIALISVREGIIQLGSLNKVEEDLNLVINIQGKFCSLLQCIPGVLSIPRPFSTMKQQIACNHDIVHCYSKETTTTATLSTVFFRDAKPQFSGLKRSLCGQGGINYEVQTKSAKIGNNSPHTVIRAETLDSQSSLLWPPTPPLPSHSYFEDLPAKIPSSHSATASSPPLYCSTGPSLPLVPNIDYTRQKLIRLDPYDGGVSGFSGTKTQGVGTDQVDTIACAKDGAPAWFVGVGGMPMICNDNSIQRYEAVVETKR